MVAHSIPTTVHPDSAPEVPRLSERASAGDGSSSPSPATPNTADEAVTESASPGADTGPQGPTSPDVNASPELTAAAGETGTPQPAAAGSFGRDMPSALGNDHFAATGYQAYRDGIPRDGHGMVSPSQTERWVAGWGLAARQAERVQA